MKRENQPNPLQYGKEDLDFLDDRIQFLDTVRRMIDIELEQRGVNSAGDPHPDNTPLTLGTGPPATVQRIVATTHEALPEGEQRKPIDESIPTI